LKETLATLDDKADRVPLPAPMSNLKVEKITVAAPGSGSVVVSDVGLQLSAGQAMGLIGASGSGKSSFARAITGVWPLVRGCVRLDDADIANWPSDQLGRHIGYLPQDVSLLDGTIAQNISRFDPDASGMEIISAAKSAGVHELILHLPQGYETQVGVNGAVLSAGQRQRVALARALYGSPFLVVLDEPNSNLDSEGEAALTKAIAMIREQGNIAIVIAHRPSALAVCNLVGLMQGGKLVAFGPKDEVLAKYLQPTVASGSVSRAAAG
jgi:ATP-binding cassette subfamily C protein